MTATDADSAEAGRVHYRLVSQVPGDKFAIDPETGQISTKSELDRDVKGGDSYQVSYLLLPRC